MYPMRKTKNSESCTLFGETGAQVQGSGWSQLNELTVDTEIVNNSLITIMVDLVKLATNLTNKTSN